MKFSQLLCIGIFVFLLVGCGESDPKSDLTSAGSTEIDSAHDNSKPFDLEQQKTAYQLTPFEILAISESPYDSGPALAVTFSVPLDLNRDIQGYLNVVDDNNKKVDGAWVVNPSRTRAYFQFIEPGASYRVTVERAITSINDQSLTKQVNQKVTIGQLKNSVEFTNKGQILPSKLTRGIPVESVNIEQVDIHFHRVFEQDVPRVIGERLNGYSYYVREIPEYSELAYTARFSLDYESNKKRTTILPIHRIKELQLPGLYIAVMKPAGEYPYDYQVTSFYLSDLALQVAQFDGATGNQAYVQAMTIEKGQTVANAELKVISRKGDQLATGKTDKRGSYRFENIDDDAVIIAQHLGDFSVISLASPALDLSEQLSLTRKQQSEELFLYGPRDLYRPGETVDVNGILRDHDGNQIPSVPLEAKLLRPDGRVAKSFSWLAEDAGFYQKQFAINKTDPTGIWTLSVNHPGHSKFEYQFSVEEFLPETMKLALTTEHQEFESPNKDIRIKGQGDYLYGAPASNNRISARMTIKPNHFPLEALKDFYFGSVANNESVKLVELDDQTLNKKGEVNWLVPNFWQNKWAPTEIVFEASLFESGGRPVTRRIRQNIWAGEHQVGLRPVNAEKILTPFESASFELINANSKAELKSIGELEINLIREDTNYYWRERNSGWDYAQSNNETRVFSQIINDNSERLTIDIPVEYGRYRLEVKDNKGTLKNSYAFFAGWHWDESGEVGISGARPDKVRIKLNKESYRGGDVAKATLISPHLGQALVRVESSGILWQQQIELTSLEQQIEIPINEGWDRHDLYLTAMVVSPSTDGSTTSDGLVQLPKRALGVQALVLDRENRSFDIVIQAPEVVEPEQTISVMVQLTEPEQLVNSVTKERNQGWVTLAAVDTGVLSLSGYKTPNPFDWFYGQRAYQGQLRDSFSQLIKNKSGKLGVQKFGGDAELSRGGEQPATDVQIVSIFSKLVEFDELGGASIELDLPNFNGELRLMAVAFSGNQFASNDTTMKVRAPIVATLSLPRFLAKHDKTSFAFDLQNMSGASQELTSQLTFEGAISANNLNTSTVFNDGQKKTSQIPVVATGIGEGRIKLELKNAKGDLYLTRSWFINVRPAYPAEFIRERKVVQKGSEPYELKAETVESYDPLSLQAKMTLSSKPPIDISGHLQGLLQYPYGCLEQTSSRAWPLMNYQSFSQPMTLDAKAKKILSEKKIHIESAIQRINGMQKSNGSFGLWGNQSDEEHWLTVYALDFLLQAKQSGYSVPQSVLDKGLKRVKSYVHSVQTSYAERSHYSQNAKHYALAFRAYAAYLLSSRSQLTLSEVRSIDNKLSSHSESGLPFAHLASAYENLGDTQSALKFWSKAINYKKYSTRYMGDYGSQLRDTAWVMTLASKSQLDFSAHNLSYQNLIFSVNDQLMEKQWFSTQERFAIYQLALSLDKNAKADWTAVIRTGDDSETVMGKKSYSKWLNAKMFKQQSSVSLTEGESLFVDVQIVGYPLQTPAEVSEGISTQKKYYDLQGRPLRLNQVKSGDYVLTRIDIASSKRIPDALLVDLLPAGFELENPGLEFSQDFSEVKVDGTYVYEWHYQSDIKHREFRDDRFVAAVSLQRRQSSVIFYLMRAVTPGVYQIPSTQVEDMYRPYLRSLSAPMAPVTVTER
jgi:uncharacterized protein YfaS (alpha-2-macroglobulin family)